MSEAARRAQEMQKDSQSMEEMARRMLEQATPEQRRELERLAREFMDRRGEQPGAGPGATPIAPGIRAPAEARQTGTESVDVRRKPDREPMEWVIAEWYSDKPVERGGAVTSPSEDLQRAARGAEQAFEQQAIPPRYSDLVKRVFKRYAEQAPGATGPTRGP